MPVEIDPWMAELEGRIKDTFGPRLLFLGLQGSYRRGEASAESDIDVVAVLDRLDAEDLPCYRALVRAMPHGALACGFLCGLAELLSWPKFDLLQLFLDTEPRLGSLEDLLPPFTEEDADQAVQVGASVIYHMAVHGFLYEADRENALHALVKPVYFLLRLRVWRDTGRWCLTKAELRTFLPENEQHLLDPPENAETQYALLLDWSSRLLLR